MRVVIAHVNEVTVEEVQGHDALGVERWAAVDLRAEDEHGDPEVYPYEWVAMVALAITRGDQS